jgi:hypothetical protein
LKADWGVLGGCEEGRVDEGKNSEEVLAGEYPGTSLNKINMFYVPHVTQYLYEDNVKALQQVIISYKRRC